jgi:hypothetical protein
MNASFCNSFIDTPPAEGQGYSLYVRKGIVETIEFSFMGNMYLVAFEL